MANLFFYSLIALWLIFRMIYGYNLWVYFINVACHLTPALMLIFAICHIRSQIKKLNEEEIMAREMLIRVHAFIFISFILFSTTSQIVRFIAHKHSVRKPSDPDYNKECRDIVTVDIFRLVANVANTAILFLFTFMSIKFSKQLRVRAE